MRPLKIIWNITNKCGYDCEICATYSDREELDTEGKTRVLHSIFSIGAQNITEIDFAGGDPLFVTDTIDIICATIDLLGRDKVSVTTTGKGINAAISMGKDLSCLLHNCEITIDSIDHFPNYLRKDFSYIIDNQEVVREVNKKINNLTINVPILNPQMDDGNIERLVNAIVAIDVPNISVNLIRLMNVGRMGAHTQPKPCSPEQFVESFIKYAKNTCVENIHIHCALRGKILGSPCNMLHEKIGIDCSGNVFACAWGGYVDGYNKYNISENPFYIGNLSEKSLLEVLADKRAIELEQLVKAYPTKYCRVHCFNKDNTLSVFKGNDPLFKNNE